jgi:hypothetical protein
VAKVAAGDKDRLGKDCLGEATTWAEAAAAFHHINAATQAAADAIPRINISAKRTCLVRLLLASIFPFPSCSRPCSYSAKLAQY